MTTAGEVIVDGLVTADVAFAVPIAAAVGLTAGEVITELGGRQMGSAAALARALSSHRPGERVQVGWVDPAAFSRSAPVLLSGGPAP